MRNLLPFIFSLLAVVSFSQVCTIDYSQTQTGIYPDTMPVGYVGQAYSEDITFVMPLDTMGYDFTNFYIMSVSLPVGLNWECNNVANNCNYNPQQSQYGCVNISGTPLLAGVYSVFVTVIADLTIVQGYPFQFQLYFEVLPSTASTSNNGFSMTGPTGCSPITVNFTNNNPGLLAYSWDFGNGNISTLENPVPQVYNAPGDYVVEYNAWNNLDTIDVYTFTGLTVTSMSNFGGGFPSFETADAYFILKENGTSIFQSSIMGNQNPPVSWSTGIILNPANTYVVEVWEADDSFGELQFFGDDFMGSHTLMLTGCNGCAAGTSNINYTVNLQIIYPNPSVISIDTVHVYGYPPVPQIAFDSPSLTLSTPDLGFAYQWYVNDSPISGATNPSYTIFQSGVYHVVAINSTGCVSFSDTLTGVYCDPDIQPVILVEDSSQQLIADEVPLGYTIQWFLNDQPISGATNDTIPFSTSGNYTVEIVDSFGCVHTSAPLSLGLGIEELSSQWMLFPNPAVDIVFLEFPDGFSAEYVELVDLTGRVLSKDAIQHKKHGISIANLPEGMVFVRVYLGDKYQTKQLMIRKK